MAREEPFTTLVADWFGTREHGECIPSEQRGHRTHSVSLSLPDPSLPEVSMTLRGHRGGNRLTNGDTCLVLTTRTSGEEI